MACFRAGALFKERMGICTALLSTGASLTGAYSSGFPMFTRLFRPQTSWRSRVPPQQPRTRLRAIDHSREIFARALDDSRGPIKLLTTSRGSEYCLQPEFLARAGARLYTGK